MFVNPYLIALLKKTWLVARYGKDLENFPVSDYQVIADTGGLGYTYVPKVLRADTQLRNATIRTLDRLCKAVNKQVSAIPPSWKDLQKKEHFNKIFLECESIPSHFVDSRIIDLTGQYKDLSKRIEGSSKAAAFKLAEPFLEETDDYGSLKSEQSNLPYVQPLDLYANIVKAKREDVAKIYEFAHSQNSYGNCPINGPEIKTPWWEQNSKIFHVIHDEEGKVCGNINVLPIKEECYEKIRSGIIDEREIQPGDLYKTYERHKVKRLYIEGFNCKPIHVGIFLREFEDIVGYLADPSNPDLKIGAIGGTKEGERLMKTLHFSIVSYSEDRLDELDFFELDYNWALEKYKSLYSLIRHRKKHTDVHTT